MIRKAKPSFDHVEDIRLVAVVSKVDDESKSACWALEPSIKLVTYSLAKLPDGHIGVVPSVVLDTSIGGGRMVNPPMTEEEHLKGYDNLRDVYFALKKRIQSDVDPAIKFNPSPQDYIGVFGRTLFITIHMKKKWVRLDIMLKPKDVGNNPRLIDYESSNDYSYLRVESTAQIDDELMSWIKMAYQKQK